MTASGLTALLRPRVSLAVAAGALFGVLYHDVLRSGALGEPAATAILLTPLGAGLLCAGCSALNQVQERGRDARMRRTRRRPMASGRLSVRAGLLASAALIAAGLLLFFLSGGPTLLGLGLAVPLIYNGVYTPLKPLTPMALLAGGLSGALPPLTGWAGAGGSPLDPAILSVTFVFYLWQVPHFWLLQEKHRSDYVRAGFATLDARLSSGVRTPLLALWVGAYFVGLGVLALGSGDALGWLVPPAVLLVGGWALLAVVREQTRTASVAVYASLPLTLAALLSNGF